MTTTAEPRPQPGGLAYGVGATPVGPALVAWSDLGVAWLSLLAVENEDQAMARLARRRPGVRPVADPARAAEVLCRVETYLRSGDPCDDLPLDLAGTPFQSRVWQALRRVPWGSTTTYGALATALGLPVGAARAVGTACGSNPVALLVPCHRVVRSGGGLGGYEYGLDCKRRLLDLEGRGRSAAPASGVAVGR